MKPETHARRCTKVANTAVTARLSSDHRKHRRWINLVVKMTRHWVKQEGLTKGSTRESHVRHMRRFHSTKRIPQV